MYNLQKIKELIFVLYTSAEVMTAYLEEFITPKFYFCQQIMLKIFNQSMLVLTSGTKTQNYPFYKATFQTPCLYPFQKRHFNFRFLFVGIWNFVVHIFLRQYNVTNALMQ